MALLSNGRMPYGASINAFGLVYLIFVIRWMYAVRCEHYCLWHGLSKLCHRMAVRHMAIGCMARVSLPLAWVTSSLSLYGHMPYGASIIWREYYWFGPGFAHLCYRVAERCMARE